jgi:hypothetical protein
MQVIEMQYCATHQNGDFCVSATNRGRTSHQSARLLSLTIVHIHLITQTDLFHSKI